MPGFLQTSPQEPFLFADFALYSFVAINHSHEYNAESFQEIIKSEGGLGDLPVQLRERARVDYKS